MSSWIRLALSIIAAVTLAASSHAQAWMSPVAVPPATNKPHILLIHDMEGLAGQDDPYSMMFGHAKYPETQRLLTQEVNAVIAGLFAGGAGSVSVADGHGSGNPDADILLDQLDGRARMISRPRSFDTYLDLPEAGAFDAVAVVGMHAKSGSGGFAAHTCSFGVQVFINDHSITETELFALLHGSVGIPLIFASGDDRLAHDLETMPWIQFVTTKKARNAWSADLYPVAQVHAALEAKARVAVEHLASAKAMRASAPIRVAVHAVPPANLRRLQDMPGVAYQDETVSFTAADMFAAYRGIRPIVWAMAESFHDAERAALDAHPDGKKIRYQGDVELFRRWLDAESGLLKPERSSSAQAKREHHGFQ